MWNFHFDGQPVAASPAGSSRVYFILWRAPSHNESLLHGMDYAQTRLVGDLIGCSLPSPHIIALLSGVHSIPIILVPPPPQKK